VYEKWWAFPDFVKTPCHCNSCFWPVVQNSWSDSWNLVTCRQQKGSCAYCQAWAWLRLSCSIRLWKTITFGSSSVVFSKANFNTFVAGKDAIIVWQLCWLWKPSRHWCNSLTATGCESLRTEVQICSRPAVQLRMLAPLQGYFLKCRSRSEAEAIREFIIFSEWLPRKRGAL